MTRIPSVRGPNTSSNTCCGVGRGMKRFGTLVLAPVDDPALLSAGDKLKNNFLTAIQPGSAVPLGCRQDQPTPRHDFICATLAQHSVTAVRFQDQRWRLARHSFPPDFHCFAPVGPGRVGLGVNRESGEKQPGKACKEHSKSDLKGPGV